MTEDRLAGAPRASTPPLRCVVAGGSLVGLSAAIALSRLGFEVTVAERSLAPGALPAPVRQRLADFAAARWPSPWREALTLALETGTVFGTPIVHYKPTRLVTGRVALARDAAHPASPMVGGGFRQGLYDVLALAQALSPVGSPAEVPDALIRYQDARLAAAIRHVTRSEQETAAYLAHATRRTAR
jgi:2-polyprenyl-6-methoxyphenol hydroxylase-like FAD-dependent oxidoreductase